jgi:hypothetical protein
MTDADERRGYREVAPADAAPELLEPTEAPA